MMARVTSNTRSSYTSSCCSVPLQLRLLLLLLGVWCVPQCCARVFGRCELAQKLHTDYQFTMEELPDWLCLVRYESSYNTAAIHYNKHSTDNGLFQINSAYWCGDSGYNGCNIDCSLLLDDDISDDVSCARLVFVDGSRGYSQWTGWRQHCKGRDLSGYIKGCDLHGGPPAAQGVRYSVHSWVEVYIRYLDQPRPMVLAKGNWIEYTV